MASSGKKKTTMAKLTRESRLRERRLDKKARKDARKQAAANGVSEQGATLPEMALPDATDVDAPLPNATDVDAPLPNAVGDSALAHATRSDA